MVYYYYYFIHYFCGPLLLLLRTQDVAQAGILEGIPPPGGRVGALFLLTIWPKRAKSIFYVNFVCR